MAEMKHTEDSSASGVCKNCNNHIREKLAELLGEVQYLGGLEEKIADHLIANGVTVQQWIPVSERKPDLELVEARADDFYFYPCLATIKKAMARGGRYVGKAWYDGEEFVDSDFADITSDVTHWMPLPQPPKGE